ncbi:tRNA lysidine(34) synthetase TilS [Caulobacter sp. NIBR1757]|uniref:tRNA lysidine(34) synthetase TilS n=1 Tax=Caulobacter sp. NIBR1757 TaxID=3016000 RepID=UPI0032AF6E56
MTVQVADPVATRVAAVLDERLETHSDAPLAVALSGGSDSLALLHLVSGWARQNGRPVIALTVDHGLQAVSAAWAERCAEMAAERGRAHRTLTWDGDKPATGLPAAARAARHALLAKAARDAGATVLLMGHTASDLGESAAMRAAGSTVPDAREWGPSPAWPDGRGVFVLRPMLGLKRGDLQDWLARRGKAWIDDPANLDLRYARARARAGQLGSSPLGSLLPSREKVSAKPTDEGVHRRSTQPLTTVSSRLKDLGAPSSGPSGHLLPRGEKGPLTAADHAGIITLHRDASAREIAAACLCAAGTSTPPRTEQLDSLLARIAREDTIATLAGARIEATGDTITVCRETGELSRAPSPPLRLSQNEPAVFDGRFELTAEAPGLTVQPLWGHTARLPKSQQSALKALPPAVRGALPLVSDGAGVWTCPILAASPSVRIRSLVRLRFEAALGLITKEADAHPVAPCGEPGGGVLH